MSDEELVEERVTPEEAAKNLIPDRPGPRIPWDDEAEKIITGLGRFVALPDPCAKCGLTLFEDRKDKELFCSVCGPV